MTVILGGSGSGKSAYAEEYLTTVSTGKKKYYIATMQVSDGEGQKKIERHQRLRNGKGFHTIEQTIAIQNVVEKMAAGEKTALLECISNLTANEMFSKEIPREADIVVEEVMQGITRLKEEVSHLVVVSNNVFEDGRIYDETTMEYIGVMGSINEKLAALAEKVIEVVVGIPVILKEKQAE